MSIKVYSPDWSVKNLRASHQDYDNFTVNWTSSARQKEKGEEIAGYLIELNTLPDTYHLKAHKSLPASLQSRYVLLLPEEKYSTGGYLAVHNQLPATKIEELLTGVVLNV